MESTRFRAPESTPIEEPPCLTNRIDDETTAETCTKQRPPNLPPLHILATSGHELLRASFGISHRLTPPPGLDLPVPSVVHDGDDARHECGGLHVAKDKNVDTHPLGQKLHHRRRSSVVLTTSRGRMLADVPVHVPHSPPHTTKSEVPNEKKETFDGRKVNAHHLSIDRNRGKPESTRKRRDTLSRFRRFFSSGDVVVRMEMFGLNLTSTRPTTTQMRYKIFDLGANATSSSPHRKLLYESESVPGVKAGERSRWRWKEGTFTTSAGHHHFIQISVYSGKEVSARYESKVDMTELAGVPDGSLKLQSCRKASCSATMEVKRWTIEYVRTDSPSSQSNSPQPMKSVVFHQHKNRRRSIGEVLVSSVPGGLWVARHLSSPKFRRGSRERTFRSQRFSHDVSNFSPEKREPSDFKPSDGNVSITHFFTIEEFQEELRRAKTRVEYCNCISAAQRFFTKNVALKTTSLDSASVMVKELKRQIFYVNNVLISDHNKMTDRLQAVEYVCALLRESVKTHVRTQGNSTRRLRRRKSSGTVFDPVIAIVMWIAQSMGENRVGKQVFDAVETMLGIDLLKDINFVLYDMKNTKNVDREMAKVRIHEDEIVVERIHHFQLCRNGHTGDDDDDDDDDDDMQSKQRSSGFELMFHIRSMCVLLLNQDDDDEMKEMFKIEMCYTPDGPDERSFDPTTQNMIMLHAAPHPIDVDALDRKYDDLQKLFLERFHEINDSNHENGFFFTSHTRD